MNSRLMSALVGLFVVVIATLTIGLVLFIGDREFSGKEHSRYELLYDSSVKGLTVGAPVTLRGVRIGEVIAVKAKLYAGSQRVLNSVLVDIYPDTIVQETSSGEVRHDDNLIDQLIKQGLSAKLGLQSILTGMLYVEVDTFGGEPTFQQVKTEYPQIPTMPNDLEAIFKDLEQINLMSMAEDMRTILANLSKLSGDNELAMVSGNLNSALNRIEDLSVTLNDRVDLVQKDFSELAGNLNHLVVQLNSELPNTSREFNATLNQLQASMKQLDKTLADVSNTVSSDSPLVYQLEQSSKDLGRASRAIEDLAGMLENQPDSVLFGRKGVIR